MATINGTNNSETLTGTESDDQINGRGGNDQLYGMGGDDELNGGDGNDVLDGGTGADTMNGGKGDDLYFVDNIFDEVDEANDEGEDTVHSSVSYSLTGTYVEHLVLTGNATQGTGNSLNNRLIGTDRNNRLRGLDGDDYLNGGAGNDLMIGGRGDDRYVVDQVGDTVQELAGEGTDRVDSSVSFTLSADVENLVLTGNSEISGTGNDLDNNIQGNARNNLIDGGAGADRMEGRAGNDRYIVDNAGDRVLERAGEGDDTVDASVSYSLAGQYVETLRLTGSGDINATGNGQANTLIGNTGDNVLDGMGGADRMAGDAGDDTYIVDNEGDVVIEEADDGTDTVRASVTFALSAEVENLTLTGTGAIDATGNDMDNVLTGNDGNNRLDGHGGADAMIGGMGNDVYVVDNAGDAVTELADGGVDWVESSVDFTLGANIENLRLTGSGHIDGTGNADDNMIIGNRGGNILDGGAGADMLEGGRGSDRYIVDDEGDVVIEHAGQGTDTVDSSVSYTLGADVENLTLTGTGSINGTGNATANRITGNDVANVIDGGAGDDRINGGDGNDTLTGGAGHDRFIFDAPNDGVDDITDFTSGEDKIYLHTGVYQSFGGSFVTNDQAFRLGEGAGPLSEEQFVLGTQSHDADDRILYDSATGNIWYDADGNGGLNTATPMLFATVEAGTVLTAADFITF